MATILIRIVSAVVLLGAIVISFYTAMPALLQFMEQFQNVISPQISDSAFTNLMANFKNQVAYIIPYSLVAIAIGAVLFMLLAPYEQEPVSYQTD